MTVMGHILVGYAFAFLPRLAPIAPTRAPHVAMSASAFPLSAGDSWLSGIRSVKAQELWKGSSAVVRDHMTTDVITLSPNQSLKEAARTWGEAGVTGAPVVHDGKLLGILSQTDILHKLAGIGALDLNGPRSVRYMENTSRLLKVRAQTVDHAMTAHPATIRPDESIQSAASVLLRRRINQLVVVCEKKQLLGVITSTDIVHSALESELDA